MATRQINQRETLNFKGKGKFIITADSNITNFSLFISKLMESGEIVC